ncbi:DUF7577 domain-containing protein [Natronorubrum sp. DTA28]
MGSNTQIDQPVRCRACGTTNDHYYTYCRNCLQTLPPKPDAKR